MSCYTSNSENIVIFRIISLERIKLLHHGDTRCTDRPIRDIYLFIVFHDGPNVPDRYSKTGPDSWPEQGFEFIFQTFSLWLYFSSYMWIGYMAVFELIRSTVLTRYVVPCILGICFVGVLIESGFSHELEYLKTFSQDGTAWECIQNLHLIRPKIYMTVVCYHMDYDGEHHIKVDTFKGKEELLFGSWVDVSETETQTKRNFKAAVAQVKISPAILFGNQDTFEEYKRLATAMIYRNLHQDEFINFSLRIEIPGMKERFLGHIHGLQKRPFWMRPVFFWIATLLWMTWPYRWLFRAKTGKIHYTLKKKIYKSVTSTNDIADSAIADLVVVNTSVPYVLVPYPPLGTALANTLPLVPARYWMDPYNAPTAHRSCLSSLFQLDDGPVPIPRMPYRSSLTALNVNGSDLAVV